MKNNQPYILRVLTTILLLFPVFTYAQTESILPLQNNAKIKSALLQADIVNNAKTASVNDTLFLPFFDDFSNFTVWPSEERWIDSTAFINYNFPINPPTLGVATFDGLDKSGNPYNVTNVNAAGLCDQLTSRALNLFNDDNGLPYDPTDSIFIIFYFQRMGRGDKPESSDSLELQFLDQSSQQWNHIWGAKGTTAGDTVFTKVKIAINDPVYRQNGFRFRFRNFGSLTGMLDIWNIDYVSLNKFIPPDYENLTDFAYVYEGYSLLDTYSAIPWEHYTSLSAAQQVSILKQTARLTIRNNNLANPFPVKIAGTSIDQYGNSTPIIGGGGSNSIAVPLNTNVTPPADIDPSFFFQDATMDDHAAFTIVYEMGQTSGGVVDDYPHNDTLKYVQNFSNYYSYDDGSAELGYGIVGTGAQLAYKFDLLKGDTLRAVNIFFAQLGASVTNQIFKLAVWSGAGAGPVGAPVYQKFNLTPNYVDSINGFYTYLTDPIYLPAGTWYFGFIQNNSTILNLGLDVNTAADPSKKYINTNGSWTTSQLPGMWMIRPVLSGEPINVGISDPDESELLVYPVPATDLIHVEIPGENIDALMFQIADVTGRVILSEKLSSTINVSSLKPGVYFLHISNSVSDSRFVRKIIISGNQ
jgi:hypothetical protein